MRMTMKEKKILTKALCEQYRKASKAERYPVDTIVKATKYTRSYASYLLRNQRWATRLSATRGCA